MIRRIVSISLDIPFRLVIMHRMNMASSMLDRFDVTGSCCMQIAAKRRTYCA